MNGIRFNLLPEKGTAIGIVKSTEPVAIYVNGQLVANTQDTIAEVNLPLETAQEERLMATIKEKNRLHRYRLRPLNEAYIYLFRRHEMGHLAYEMEDLDQLVAEKEVEIQQLMKSYESLVEIEFIKPWSPPRNYPEDEVPAFIPEPQY